ncbi:MAG: hypothetical protein EBQ99_05795 [Planctomycetes bacterium]|nr:hypothetical protein [Planctomycetota bacterium]
MRLVGGIAWIVLCLVAAACGGGGPKGDPMRVLANTEAMPSAQEEAMLALDAAASPEYVKQLRRIILQPGYTQPIREMAFARLERLDPKALKEVIAMNLPKMQMLAWRTWLCERIAQQGWKDMTPTLVRAWAAPMPGWVEKDEDRPERKALSSLHGSDRLTDVLADLLVSADPSRERNLRLRCWELLQKQGQRDRLVAILADASVKPDDDLLRDLRKCASELGIVPETREEILWLQAILSTSNAVFWQQAREATAKLPEATRRSLEIRELPVAVAALRHRPELLQCSNEDLYARVSSRREANGSRIATATLDGYGGDFSETLYAQKGKLRWGDLVAMVLAMDLLDDPSVRTRLFDLGDRDLHDRTTEYGGVIVVGADGKPTLEACIPRQKGNDLRFEAPQSMFDQGYTGLFHFHLHCQSYDNERYAGPHIGDFTYANSTRANCLVFTFLKRGEMNVDFYRHGPVVVDLGSIRRPERGS